MKFFHTFLLSIFFLGCTSITEEGISGKWLMHQVIQDGQDVTSEHDPYDERFLLLKSDSTFESGGRPFGENTGKYSYNIKDQTLFLDSDAGPEDDSQWQVTIQGDTMHWQGLGSEWAKGFELIQVRKKN